MARSRKSRRISRRPTPSWSSKLSEDGRGRGEKAKKVFKGEGEILKELKFLVQDKQKRKIYVLQGDGEADINNKEGADRGGNFDDTFSKVGIGFFVDRLAGDGYDVTGVSFHKEFGKAHPNVKPIVAEGGKKDIPADCETLIVPGISTKLPDDALEGIHRYLERGGKLIAFFDVVVNDDYTKMIDTGLEGVLAKGYGVNVTNEFPLRVLRAPNPTTCGPSSHSRHAAPRTRCARVFQTHPDEADGPGGEAGRNAGTIQGGNHPGGAAFR